MTKGLPKVADVEKESEYGFVYAVSGPGKFLKRKFKGTLFLNYKSFNCFKLSFKV